MLLTFLINGDVVGLETTFKQVFGVLLTEACSLGRVGEQVSDKLLIGVVAVSQCKFVHGASPFVGGI